MFFQQGGATNWWTTRICKIAGLPAFTNGLDLNLCLIVFDMNYAISFKFSLGRWISQCNPLWTTYAAGITNLPYLKWFSRRKDDRKGQRNKKTNDTNWIDRKRQRACSARGGCVGHGGQQIVWFISAGKNGQFAPSICGILRNKCCSFPRVELCGLQLNN